MPRPARQVIRNLLTLVAGIGCLLVLIGDFLIRLLTKECDGTTLCALRSEFISVTPGLSASLISFLALQWLAARIGLGSVSDYFASRSENPIIERQKSLILADNFRHDTLATAEIISELDIVAARKVFVIANTGKFTVSALLQLLGRVEYKNKELDVDILLCSPHYCEYSHILDMDVRTRQFKQFMFERPNINLRVRHYAMTPCLSCVIAENSTGELNGSAGFYRWNVKKITSNHPYIRVNSKDTRSDYFISLYRSWFDHLWGSGNIHTIAFDFDDTLFVTTRARTFAWLQAIQRFFNTGRLKSSDLSEQLRSKMDNLNGIEAVVENAILSRQEEREVMEELLPNLSDESTIEEFRTLRASMRERFTLELAEPIPGILQDIKELAKNYQIVIVSNTSSNLINKVLDQHKVSHLFSYVIGRDEVREKWHDVAEKTQQLVRISNIIGVPLDRVVFVGDSYSDYLAARQLHIRFVENRFNARRLKGIGRLKFESLIHPPLLSQFIYSVGNDLVGEITKLQTQSYYH